ncbi:response regulator [Campylobacter sp. 19-13652]|uniref:response regulator n=1 Tax=Campylobacter sp. 19-13652 TaxID=2840180 RepID=UPI001C770722|nr:response regulator [Campylobacter sp. 19-13652]BCX78600.1 hypothetical protein LBC_00620 [Campylobacter sp. 19-13652]
MRLYLSENWYTDIFNTLNNKQKIRKDIQIDNNNSIPKDALSPNTTSKSTISINQLPPQTQKQQPDKESQKLFEAVAKEIVNINQIMVNNVSSEYSKGQIQAVFIERPTLQRHYTLYDGDVLDSAHFESTHDSEYSYSIKESTDYFFKTTDKFKSFFHTSYLNYTINDYARSEYLQTDFGEVKVFLDIFDNNDAFKMGDITQNVLLLGFDSNGDGLLNSDDKLFSKLKVRGYDKDGNEKIAKLSDVVSQVDLEKFIKTDYKDVLKNFKDSYANKYVNSREIDETSDPYKLFFKAEYRYKRVDDDETKKFFEAYADEDGWVDLKKNSQIFDKINNFAYVKSGLDGELRLSEFNSFASRHEPLKGEVAYAQNQTKNFLTFYNDYQKAKQEHQELLNKIMASGANLPEQEAQAAQALLKFSDELGGSAKMIAMQNDFRKNTGIEFSEQNLEKLKAMFLSDPKKAAQVMNDLDSVVAMKLNQNGTITLKFDSGREIMVNELFTDTGKLNTIGGKRVGINLKAKQMSDEEINKLDFEKVGIITNENGKEEITSLKDLGVKAIRNFGVKGFILVLNSGKQIYGKDLFNIMFLDDKTNKKEIKEEDRFYKKVDMWA